MSTDAPRKAARRTRARKRPDRYHHGDLRRAVIQETVRLISEADVAAVSLRDVARRLGVTPAAPYHHFHDKAELLAAVAEDGFRGLLAAVMESLGQRAGAEPRVLCAVAARAYVAFATSHEAHYRTMFLPELRDRERFASLHQAGGGALDALVSLVHAARPTATLDAVRALAVAFWSSWHGFAMLANDGVLASHPDLRDREALFSAVLAVMDLALAAPDDRRSA